MIGSSPRDWVHDTAARAPGQAALAGDVHATYAGLAERADEEARRHAWEPGAAVPFALAAPGLDAVAGLWGAWRACAVAVPHDASRPCPELGGGHAGAHTVVLTSGTAGAPRAVVLTEANVAAAVAAAADRLGNGAADRWLLVLPLFHVGGLSVLWRSAAAGGTAVVHERFDAARVASTLRTGAATFASLVPTMLRRVLAADAGPYPGEPLVLLGGAAAPPSLVEQGLDAGLRVVASYGLSEACSQVATVVPGEERRSVGTAGPPLAGVTVRVVDDHGHPVPNGEAGRITVDGAAVSPGYAGEAARSGPLVTADLGRIDEEGRLVVLGRADDVIVTGGENVHPAEVEALLAGCPGVAEAAVYGEPDPEWGHRVVAAVVPSPAEEFDPTAAVAWMKDRAPAYLIPKVWRVVPHLPRNPTGKPDRQALQGE